MPIQNSGPISIDDIRTELGQTTGSFEALMETHSALLKFDNRYAKPKDRTVLTTDPKSIGEYYGYGNLGELRGVQGRDVDKIIQHLVYYTVNNIAFDSVNVYFNNNATPTPLFSKTLNPDFTTEDKYVNPISVINLDNPVVIGKNVAIREFQWSFDTGTYIAKERIDDTGKYCRLVVENTSFSGTTISFNTRLLATFQGTLSGIVTEVLVDQVGGGNVLTDVHTGATALSTTTDTHSFTATLNNWYRITARVRNKHIGAGVNIGSGSLVAGNSYYVSGTFTNIGERYIEHGGRRYGIGGAFVAGNAFYSRDTSNSTWAQDLNIAAGGGDIVSESVSYIYF